MVYLYDHKNWVVPRKCVFRPLFSDKRRTRFLFYEKEDILNVRYTLYA